MRLNKALLTTAVALSLAVAGCSGGSSDGGAAQEGPVTLSYGVWDQNQVPALKQMIADFEKTNKNIKFHVATAGFYDSAKMMAGDTQELTIEDPK